jgi:hypothetical protein
MIYGLGGLSVCTALLLLLASPFVSDGSSHALAPTG